MRFLLLTVILLTATFCQAAQVADTAPPFQVGGVYDGIGERIDQLPEDGHAWHVSAFTEQSPSGKSQQIVSWFNYGDLARLKAQTHWHVYSPASSVWKRYEGTFQSFPCVRVQDARGRVIFQASGNSCHLDSPESLTRAIAVSIHGYKQYPDTVSRPCPGPCPQPCPPYTPEPGPFTPKPPIPDIGPDDADPNVVEIKKEEHHELIIALVLIPLALLVAAGIAYVNQRHRQV